MLAKSLETRRRGWPWAARRPLSASWFALAPLALTLLAASAAAQPDAEPVHALEVKIGDTPAQSINLAAAARVGPAEQLPIPPRIPSSVVPGASNLKDGECRFVALFPNDEQLLCDFLRAQRGLPEGAQLLRGAVRVLAAGEQVITVKALAFPRGPLHFNAARDRFEGRVGVGLVAVTEAAPAKIATPVPFRVLGDVSSTPATQLVDHVGPPYAEIEVATPALTSSLEVQIVSAATPDAASLSLTAEPALRVVARPARIQGLGLASADVTFELVGPRQGARDVKLTTSLGQLSGDAARLLAGHARVALRSQRVGSATVTVSAAGLPPAKVEVEFMFPWELLLAALLGGLAGCLAQRRLRVGRNELLASILLGGLVALLYVWGMEQLRIELPAPAGEIAIALLATLVAHQAARLHARIRGAR